MYQKVAENKRDMKNISSLVGRKGTIIEFSNVVSPPNKFIGQSPYYVALIELEDKTRLTAQVIDCETIEEGMEVEGVFRKLFSFGKEGLIQYGVKFRPIIK